LLRERRAVCAADEEAEARDKTRPSSCPLSTVLIGSLNRFSFVEVVLARAR